MSDPKVEEIRAPGKNWKHYYLSVKCLRCGSAPGVLCYGNGAIRNGDPHDRSTQGLYARIEALEDRERVLLTKLDDAEEDLKVMVGRFDRTRERMIAAVERERVLLAGVREALAALRTPSNGSGDVMAMAILSRLLTSTPTGVAQTITIPKPHVPFGPIGIPESVADADYLRSAVRSIRYTEASERGGPFGSNLTNTIVKLLNDAADAVEQIGENRG